jgi:hypothetical protein
MHFVGTTQSYRLGRQVVHTVTTVLYRDSYVHAIKMYRGVEVQLHAPTALPRIYIGILAEWVLDHRQKSLTRTETGSSSPQPSHYSLRYHGFL